MAILGARMTIANLPSHPDPAGLSTVERNLNVREDKSEPGRGSGVFSAEEIGRLVGADFSRCNVRSRSA